MVLKFLNVSLILGSIRFCFYGAPIVATDDDEDRNEHRVSTIYYSLSQDSPHFLDIDPEDGCVKIASYYNIRYDAPEMIKYSVKFKELIQKRIFANFYFFRLAFLTQAIQNVFRNLS